MSTIELDPVAIRKRLATLREKNTPWEIAWRRATDSYHHSDDERSLFKFMEAHYRAAYHNDCTPRGRCRVDERDVSAAIRAAARVPVVSSRDQCRSGDDCSRPATHGRFGPRFCEYHHADLVGMGSRLQLALDRANPRNGGNDSLYTHKAA